MPTPNGSGATVVWNLDAKPLPEIPLPNDVATRIDPSSPTGKRINVSLEAPTAFEREFRYHANRLEGFSTFGPISVAFTAPLDIDNIIRRQRGNKIFDDDAVLLVNIQRGSRNFGKLWPLDFGHGNFPITTSQLGRYWDNDPRRDVPNLLFDTTDEDLNRNGVLDPGEDTDNDGYLDVPNVHPVGGDPTDDVLVFYEKVTNTLIFRPVVPLDPEALYAVVLTKNLTGADGKPVRSPFPYVNHARQTDVLRDLETALQMNGFKMDDVAFTWAFTTMGPTRDLEALRRGLYGVGPFARLAKEFPPDVRVNPALSEGTKLHLMPRAKILEIANFLIPFLVGQANREQVQILIESFYNVDYVIHGEVRGPNLLADKDGIATPGYPADDDEIWEINRKTGEAFYRPHTIRFWCSIPRKDRGNGPPFPVAFYNHGYTSSRFDTLAFSGMMARYGIAHCGISAYGHGVTIPEDSREIIEAAIESFGIRPIISGMIPDRARDLNNDGTVDSGADYWVAEMFHTRDMVRQTILDEMVVVRAFRAFDGVRRSQQDLDGDGRPDIAGDFDGDGVPDIGGPLQDYYVWGHSLGGIISAIFAGIEPAITAAVPICYGAGLPDVALRSSRFGVHHATILPIFGPIFVGEPGPGSGEVTISTIVRELNDSAKHAILTTTDIAPGDRIRIENLVNGEHYEAYADADRRFRLHIAADALDATTRRALLKLPTTPPGRTPPAAPDTRKLGDALRIVVYQGASSVVKKTFETFGRDVAFMGVTYPAGAPLVALAKGMGLQRNTPKFRRLLGSFAQTFVDPGDPINYTPHYFLDPLPTTDYDLAEPGANVLLMPTVGDDGVPVSTGIAGARAAGLIDLYTVDPRYGKTVNEVLIDNYIVEGLSRMRRFQEREVLMDPENHSQGRFEPGVPRLDPPLRLTRNTGRGLQALRIAYVHPRGQHCFGLPDPDRAFDMDLFLDHLLLRFLQTRGREIRDDDLCMADQSCDWIPPNAPAPGG